MSESDREAINRRVLDQWKGASHGGIDLEELDEVLERRKNEFWNVRLGKAWEEER